MNDSIDRQMAIDALGEKPLAWTEGEYELGLQNQWQSDVDALKALPTAERKGHWYKNSTLINCSVCKHCSWSVNAYEDLVKTFKYCPNCGARMESE